MLTTSRTSRRRLMTGVASVGVLVAAGLGTTASGTRAAQAVSARVGSAIGAREASTSPFAATGPQMRETSDIYANAVRRETRTVNGHRLTTITVDEDAMHDAETRARLAGERAALIAANAPHVTSGRCGDASPANAMTIRQEEGRSIVVCTDRIERAVARASQFRADRRVVLSEDGAVSAPGVSVSPSGAISMPGISVSEAGAVSAPGVSVSSDGAVSTDRLSLSSGGRISSEGDPRAALGDAVARLRSARAQIASERYIPDSQRDHAMQGIDRQIEALRERAASLD